MSQQNYSAALDFLAAGGEMGALMRQQDWSTSSLGAPEQWSQPLRTAVRLLLNTGHPIYIFWGEDGACLYNDAYRQSIGPERHPGSLGRPAREVWAEIWEVIGPQIAQVMSGGGATWNENHLIPITRNGAHEDVYWTYSYGPIDDAEAPTGVGGVLVICTETTRTVLAEQRRAAEIKRQRRWFEATPGFIGILSGPDHVFEFVNDAYRDLVGGRDVAGRPVREAFPDLEGQGFYELLDRVYASGERHVARRSPIRFQASADVEAEDRYLDFIYEPILDEVGKVTGIFTAGHDVTDQKVADEHRLMLLNELNHRVKNTLASVQAVAQQTLRDGAPMAEAREAFVDRLMAMSRNHDILTDENWSGADIHDVVTQSLSGHASEDRRRLDGPRVTVEPRVALAVGMALHELATNAVKYGALSGQVGEVSIHWTVTPGEKGGRLLKLEWCESGGPPVGPVGRKGFGSRLIERGLARDLGGQARLVYEPTGVICTITAAI